MKRGWPSQRQPPRFLDLLKKFYYFFGDSCPQHRKKRKKRTGQMGGCNQYTCLSRPHKMANIHHKS